MLLERRLELTQRPALRRVRAKRVPDGLQHSGIPKNVEAPLEPVRRERFPEKGRGRLSPQAS